MLRIGDGSTGGGGGGGGGALTIVDVPPGTTNATKNAVHEVGGGGAVVINIQAGAPKGTIFGLVLRCTPSVAAPITVNGTGTLELPVGIGGATGGNTYAATLVWNAAAEAGAAYQWYCDGADNYVLYPN